VPGDVLRVCWKPALRITASLAAAAMAEADNLNEVRKLPLLVEMTEAGNADVRSARAVGTTVVGDTRIALLVSRDSDFLIPG
jgi:hypothetical protein